MMGLWMRYRRKPLFWPVLIALLLHILLGIVSMFIYLPAAVEIRERVTEKFRLRQVTTRPVLPDTKGHVMSKNPEQTTKVTGAARQQPKPVKDIPVSALLGKDTRPRKVEVETQPRKLDTPDPLRRRDDLNRILTETAERRLRDEISPSQRPVRPNPVREHRDRIADTPEENKTWLQSLMQPLENLNLHQPENMKVDPDEGMPGFTPVKGLARDAEVDARIGEERGEVVRFESVDDFLDIELYTYEDPSDKGRYFMAKIFVKKGARLRVMPKEIVFLIDSSLSINRDRLEEFKQGLTRCLKDLNDEDVFNITAFRADSQSFSARSVPATPEAIKKAERFVGSLSSDQQTDMYGALEKAVQRPPVKAPSYLFLVSDGRPTHGIVNARELLSATSRVNGGRKPVFVYSGGAKVNRYLLDFIAYQNRAWSEYTRSASDIDKGMDAFHEKIKDPIFLDLRYRFSGVEEAEVFPKTLPDFFRGAEFTLFGRYDREPGFSMQLLGDIDGKTKELVFSRTFAEAKKGGPDVMKGWAFNKIYDGISRLTESGDDPKLVREIASLSRRYGITTPYSDELRKID
ncbi:MAG: hypothetical protein MOGMAGMI_01765 [Candidatus Omnitrophica bacterium]|nr:hypothetical protein [Candidatus Omnitrophota bacterium]